MGKKGKGKSGGGGGSGGIVDGKPTKLLGTTYLQVLGMGTDVGRFGSIHT